MGAFTSSSGARPQRESHPGTATEVYMEKITSVPSVVQQIKVCSRVDVMSVPYEGNGADTARKLKMGTHNPPCVFVFNPNTDLRLMAVRHNWTEHQGGMNWFHAWSWVVQQSMQTRGTCYIVRSKKSGMEGSAQPMELNVALAFGLDVRFVEY